MEERIISSDPTLTLGIPAGRDVSWILQILSRLDKPATPVQVLVSRWVERLLTPEDLKLLNGYFPTEQVSSRARHAPAMRNAIVQGAKSTHILFLDDDMVPEADLLNNALALAAREPDVVHQGIPYLVANSHSWLARTEGKLYERGFRKYLSEDKSVTLLDARIMLAPVDVLLETPFDESLVFGGGEGRQLSKALRERGIPLRLRTELLGSHLNRDTLSGLIAQKRAHGRGRGYQLLRDGPGEAGWLTYIETYARRHAVEPSLDWARGEFDTKELMYVWGTNTVFWLGVLEEMVRSNIKPKI